MKLKKLSLILLSGLLSFQAIGANSIEFGLKMSNMIVLIMIQI